MALTLGLGSQDWAKLSTVSQLKAAAPIGSVPLIKPAATPAPINQDVATPQPIGGLSSSTPIAFSSPKPINTDVATPPPVIPGPSPINTVPKAAAASVNPISPPMPTTPTDTATPQPIGGRSASNPMAVNAQTGAPIAPVNPPPAPKASSHGHGISGNGVMNEGLTSEEEKAGYTTDPNTGKPVAPPPTTDDHLAIYQKTADDFAAGKVDEKAFTTAANNLMMQISLSNNAERDALQMRINQDPNLRGQGAGYAMLAVMGANQDFNADQLFGKLAEHTQQTILDMQKWGVTEGLQITKDRRNIAIDNANRLIDAGATVEGAAGLSKALDFPGLNIDPNNIPAVRSQLLDKANLSLSAGDYAGWAKNMSSLTGQAIDPNNAAMRDPVLQNQLQVAKNAHDYAAQSSIYKKMGITISEDDIRLSDPFQQDLWDKMLDNIKAQAMINPDIATTRLQDLMSNPAAAKYLGFTSGSSAHDLIQSIITGEYQANQNLVAGLNKSINEQASSDVPFTDALTNYKAQGPLEWQGLENTGKAMATQADGSGLAKINAARAADGLDPYHLDANGNVVDKNNVGLTPDDFGNEAARVDYQSRQAQLKTDPVKSAQKFIMDHYGSMVLSIPGGEQTLNDTLTSLYLGGGMTIDKSTGQAVPVFTSGLPWDNPKTAYLFHTWPLATFDDKGTPNPGFDMGGGTYPPAKDGQSPVKTPEEQNLDAAYAKYLYNAGGTNPLSSTQWYFATQGGKTQPDPSKIPGSVTNVTGSTTPGSTPTPTPTPNPTPTPSGPTDPTNPVGTRAEASKAYGDFITANTNITNPAVANSVIDMGRQVADAYYSKPVDQMTPMDTGSDTQFRNASDRLQQKFGLTATDMAKFADFSKGDPNIFHSESNSWKGTPAFAYYAIYTNMVNNGLSEANAKTALVKLVGQSNADAALGLEKMHNASSDYNPSALSSNAAAINKGFSAPIGSPNTISGVGSFF